MVVLCAVLLGAQSARAQAPAADSLPPEPTPRSSWSDIDATAGGITLGRSRFAHVQLGGYFLVRYIDQMAQDSFTDHLGAEHPIDGRRDVQFHRSMVHLKGWLGDPKLRFQATLWSLNSTDQTITYGFLGYQAHPMFNVYAGVNTTGGSRSLMGNHPFWLAHDRVMADEFFRGYFSAGAWANGEVLPGFWYHGAVMDNMSILGVTAKEDDRNLAWGASLWWMPTTQEFGPFGNFGDFEWHDELATRFGASWAWSRENRMTNASGAAENTMLRLADARLIWETSALAPGVTVRNADYELWSADAGFKYRGFFLQTHYFWRRLDRFIADGPIPHDQIIDDGFYVQASGFPIKQVLELYGATSYVLGDEDVGFDDSYEYLGGLNFYPFDTRNYRLNLQIVDIHRSAVSSLFGFYVGGQTGTTISAATSVYF